MQDNYKSLRNFEKIHKISVLIIGGSSYLGQHALFYFSSVDDINVGFTYFSSQISAPARIRSFKLNLIDATKEEISEILDEFQPDAIIHLAAWSSLQQCEKDANSAFKVNAPAALLAAVTESVPKCLFLFMSTDQVYGEHRTKNELPFSEESTCRPLNYYGKSKLEFEEMLRNEFRSIRHVIFRSSNIIGPPAPYITKGKFLQWLNEKIASSVSTVDLFFDELRNFIYSGDILEIFESTVRRYMDRKFENFPAAGSVYNLGDFVSRSRVDLGILFLREAKTENIRINPVASSAFLAYPSPRDLTMNCTKLWEDYNKMPTDISTVLKCCLSLENEQK